MPMNLTDKKAVVELWAENFNKAGVIILANYSGLKANQINDLRRRCHEAGVEFKIVKNTLAKRAIKGSNYEFLETSFRDTVAIAYAVDDHVAPAKVLAKAVKDFPTLEILTGGLDGQPLDAAGIEALSKMPGLEELRGQLLGLMSNVPGGFVRLLNAVPGGLVNVLDARRRELEGDAA